MRTMEDEKGKERERKKEKEKNPDLGEQSNRESHAEPTLLHVPELNPFSTKTLFHLFCV